MGMGTKAGIWLAETETAGCGRKQVRCIRIWPMRVLNKAEDSRLTRRAGRRAGEIKEKKYC